MMAILPRASEPKDAASLWNPRNNRLITPIALKTPGCTPDSPRAEHGPEAQLGRGRLWAFSCPRKWLYLIRPRIRGNTYGLGVSVVWFQTSKFGRTYGGSHTLIVGNLGSGRRVDGCSP